MPVESIFLNKAHWTNLKALDRKPSHLSINKPKISLYTCPGKTEKVQRINMYRNLNGT